MADFWPFPLLPLLLLPLPSTSRQFWSLDLNVEVYVYADDVIYSYQLTIPPHTCSQSLCTHTQWWWFIKLDDVISIIFHIEIYRSKLPLNQALPWIQDHATTLTWCNFGSKLKSARDGWRFTIQNGHAPHLPSPSAPYHLSFPSINQALPWIHDKPIDMMQFRQ